MHPLDHVFPFRDRNNCKQCVSDVIYEYVETTVAVEVREPPVKSPQKEGKYTAHALTPK